MATPPKELVERLTREACEILSNPNSTPNQRDLSRRFLAQRAN